ncbi:cytochrome oxidase Cu insertion factor (SCO1/SenC/PrrC family) [Pedobacter africanus]|uniref:Cytochrome oxidase Cu insertion factor (SCO1/SenC/PrrC family) n=1 Tax=Pedobacter africanus TaxID=151894 RepID=A0ACC6KT72_9SPHI|nr:TlpA disulfide reductase family protein [Pedobacter africanus]MDR6782340.1 cytochrome oxidase Cu insertion factor (SCO1/SenC/PrrC family) [Pedobacter africanus]
MKIFFKFILLIFVCAFSGFAQQKNPVLSGCFKSYKKNLPATIMLWTMPTNNLWDQTVDYKVTIDSNRSFHFEFPLIKRPMLYMLQVVQLSGTKKQVSSLGTFYVEPNDNIHVDIYDNQIKSGIFMTKKDSLVFTGAGSAKYNLIENLNKDFARYLQTIYLLINKEDSTEAVIATKFEKLSELTRFYSNEKLSNINGAKNVSQEMKKIISYQFCDYESLKEERVMTFYSLAKKNNIKQFVREYYNKNPYRVTKPDTVALFCPNFFHFSALSLKRKQLINSEDKSLSLKNYYDLLKSSYSGQMKERMIMQLFAGAYGLSGLSNVNTVYDSLLKDASGILVSKEGKDVIEKKLTFKRGSRLFDADFIDLNGKTFNFSLLKGKVFLLDMWGIGCTVCAGFHHKFKNELWTDLKDKKDFVMLSVFDGKTKEKWEQGVKSNKYTSMEYLNVSNLPLGSSLHPFMRHYNVIGAPFILLVDKVGKIVTKIDANNFKSKELLTMINDELKKNEVSK